MTKHYILFSHIPLQHNDFGFVFSIADTDPSVVLIREIKWTVNTNSTAWEYPRVVHFTPEDYFVCDQIVPIVRAREIWKTLKDKYLFEESKTPVDLPPETNLNYVSKTRFTLPQNVPAST